MSSKRNTFFMRFYGQTNDKIDKCVTTVLEHHPTGKEASRRVPEMTASMGGLPYLARGEATEVIIVFPKKGDCDKCYACEQCRKTYMRYAVPKEPEAKFMGRTHGMTSLGL